MIQFKDIPFCRLNMPEFKEQFEKGIKKFEEAKSFEEAYGVLMDVDGLSKKYKSVANICEIRNTMNVQDPFYKSEADYFDRIRPEYDELENLLSKAMLNTPYREEFEKFIGKDVFEKAELQEQCFAKEIMEDLLEENQLSARYSELVATLMAKTEEGMVPLSSLGRYMGSEDRAVRSKYSAIWEATFSKISEELDDLYDKLVRVRNRIAGKLCKKSYTEIGYCHMSRTSYTKEDITHFRNTVKQKLVPVVHKLFTEQKSRLGFDQLYHYDEDINFTDGAVTPVENVVKAFEKIYSQMSKETAVYYEQLIGSGFYDLDIRPGKIMGAYSNYVAQYSMPFIFETYNGTPGALRTFAHETGHGFHSYTKRGEAFSFTESCGSDLAEIHSMSMEFLIWPYLDEVLPKEQISKYKYLHMKNALTFIPYGCAVDEFQQTVYDNPQMSPKERLELWQRLEQGYQPWKCYETDLFLKQGRAWQKQTHIYKWPFYYVDYVLAQTCALQVHFLNQKDSKEGWNCYRNILSNSGMMGFTDTLHSAGLHSPFEEGVIDELAKQAIDCMEAIRL